MSRIIIAVVTALLPFTVAAQSRRIAGAAAPDTGTLDLVISGARVFDGTGNPWFYADVGVRGGRITRVGRLDSVQATRRIDAKGKAVIPGIIDLHSHADDGARPRGGFRDPNAQRRAAPNLVMQGVTTVVVNQDGRSPLPIAEQRSTIERLGIGPNTILLVGHGSVRARVMGTDFQRPARADEVTAMRQLVRQAMRDGAWGMSAGLEYSPGRWSTTEEVVALAQEIAPFRGVYISHERSEGQDPMWFWPSQDPAGAPTLLDAVRETIEIGERTGATVVASHLKAKGMNYWGSSAAALELIERARGRGVDVWADQYPYNTSGSDGSTVLIPDWALGNGGYAANLRHALADSALSAKVRRDIAHEIARRGGAEQVMIFDFPDTAMEGKTLAQVATLWHLTPIDAAIQLQLRGYQDREGGARVRGFSLAEGDIEMIAARSWVATASDAGIALPDDGPATHARFYGTFPRKLRRYALERDILPLESAIRSMTSLPAQILGLRDRGMIREGMVADLAIIDLNNIRDKATFFEPHQYAEGVEAVLVNGVEVVSNSKPTWALPGKVLAKLGGRFQP
ncbi:MAG: N-acyl-D-amino-acid deacylase family protein [Gemmatimonadaceae bacterium]